VDWDPTYKPRLRPVEAFRVPPEDGEAEGEVVALRDSSGLSDVVLTMSVPALQVLSFMDGSRSCHELLQEYQRLFDRPLRRRTLESMLDYLEQAHFLEGPMFEAHYASLVAAYRQAPVREMPHAASLGVDAAGHVFDETLAGVELPRVEGRIRGVIAPHLDYDRGGPCYALAYGLLRDRDVPDRVVILGTNHFGRSPTVTVTGKDFETPLGRTRTDVGFIERLEARVGSLREHEFDHGREHSVELQVAWLQHVYGAEAFSIVPVLCHDPCGPTGTAPYEGDGVDLRTFSTVLGESIRDDNLDTLVIAGADLSHVGATFGDARPLDDQFLAEVAWHDRAALARLELDGADGFVDELTRLNNATRVCSAGCIFAASTALADARAEMLAYHQAVHQEAQNCVTCAAVVFIQAHHD